ncbi:MAG: alpha/beta fold hydrolase [Candidatus Nanosyncoccus sp.]
MQKKQKPTLLFVHGFRGNHFGLSEIIQKFKTLGYSTYCPDIPPAFNTQDEQLPELSNFTAESYATWLADYILDNKLDHPILIGHSMGSLITAATAEKYPNLIHEKIFFLSPISEPTPKFLRPIIPLIAFIPNKLVGYIVTKYLIGTLGKHQLPKILETTYLCAKKFTSLTDEIKAAKFSVNHSISNFDFNKDCYFIAGTEDRLNRPKQTQKVAEKYRGKTFFIKDSGHLINYEVPDQVFELIQDNL